MGVIKQAAAGIGLIGFMGLLVGCTEAETRLEDKLYWGGEDFHWFEGERFGFFKADIGSTSEDVTQSFKCD